MNYELLTIKQRKGISQNIFLLEKNIENFAKRTTKTELSSQKNVLKASLKIDYWKGACSWPMKIYQNYADVFNKTRMKSTKSKVAFIPSIYKDEWN